MSSALSFSDGVTSTPLPDLQALTRRITSAALLQLQEGSIVTASATADWQLVLVLDGLMEPGGHRRIDGRHLLAGDAFVVAPGHEFTLVGRCSLLHISYRESGRSVRRIRDFRAVQWPDRSGMRAIMSVPMLQPYQTGGLSVAGLHIPGHTYLRQITKVPTVLCSQLSTPIEIPGPGSTIEVVETYRTYAPGDELVYHKQDLLGQGWLLEF